MCGVGLGPIDVDRLIYYTFTLPDDAKVKKAEVCASADDGMRFAVNGHVRLITEARNDNKARRRSAAARVASISAHRRALRIAF